MKKFSLLILLSIMSLVKIQAQENLQFGIKGGANLYRLNFKEFGTDSRTDFHLGLLAEIPLSKEFAFQPEIVYSSQGARSSDVPSFDGRVYYDFELDYIQVPLTFKYYLIKNLALETGPSFNFMVKEQITGTYVDLPMTEISSDSAKFFEFGSVLGLSYKLPGNFFLSTRFTYGLTNAFNGKRFSTNSVTNNGFQIGTGYIF